RPAPRGLRGCPGTPRPGLVPSPPSATPGRGTPRRRSTLLLHRFLAVPERAQLGLDPLVDAAREEVGRGADAVLDGQGVGAAVADHAAALHPEERGTAVFARIDAVPHGREGALGEEGAELAQRLSLDLLL